MATRYINKRAKDGSWGDLTTYPLAFLTAPPVPCTFFCHTEIMSDAVAKVDTPREAESTDVVELSSSSETTTTGTGAGSETAKSTAPIQPKQTEAKGGSVSDLDRQIAALRRCEYLKESEVKAICAKAREILVDESNVQRVDAPVTVSGNSIFSLNHFSNRW